MVPLRSSLEPAHVVRGSLVELEDPEQTWRPLITSCFSTTSSVHLSSIFTSFDDAPSLVIGRYGLISLLLAAARNGCHPLSLSACGAGRQVIANGRQTAHRRARMGPTFNLSFPLEATTLNPVADQSSYKMLGFLAVLFVLAAATFHPHFFGRPDRALRSW